MAIIKLLIVVMSLTMAIATDLHFQSKNHYRSWRHDHGLKEKVNSELQIGFVTGVALYWIHCNAVTVYVTVACDIFPLIISLTSNWKVCSRSLPAEQLTKCLDTAVTDVVSSLAGGLKSLRILPIEPLAVDSVSIGGTQGSVTLKQEYKNIKLHGLTKGIKIYNHHLDVDNGCLLTSDSINPQVDFVADYKIEGKVLLLPVKGSGRSNITMYGLKSHNEISCEKYEKNGETYLKIKKYGVKFSPARINLQFDNLFNGDKILGPQLNNFINENSELLFKELQAPYEETFSQVFTQLSNEVFSRVPLNKIFPPE